MQEANELIETQFN